MSTPKPDWASDYPTYEDIVKSWGLNVETFQTFGSYQGDHLAIVTGPEGVGLVVFGYGSCSGCDALAAAAPWGDDADWQGVVDLAAQLRADVHFEPTRDALRDWVDANPENHWWSYDNEIASWLDANLATHLKTDSTED